MTEITTSTGQTDPAVRGVWQSRGYGRLLRIGETGVDQFEIGDACYLPPRDTAGQTEMDSVSYRFFRMLPDGERAIMQLLRGDTNVVFDRLPAMPEICIEEAPTDPEFVAETFLDMFERHYAFFDRRPPDHETRAQRLRAAITPGMDDAALWDALASYMDGLSDSHTKLIGEVNGERRRVQDGLGETLPRMRASDGGETRWLIGLLGQTLESLGDSAHHTGRDRIVWGVIDGKVGYLQIFQMGGFTDRDDFGSDAWAEAELAEFDRIMDEAFDAFDGMDAVIVDLSNNRGGWDQIAKALPGRFTDEPYVGFTTQAQGSQLAPFPHVIEPADGPRFTGPVYALTSDVTVSGGELAMLALRQNPRVTQAGQTTRGAYSTPLAKRLPNGWLVELSNEVFAAPDGTVYEEFGLEPDIDLQPYPPSEPVAGHWKAVSALAELARQK
ncbi:S41 family peptidase [Croceicoccus gelatinilyticus]|uniref:S41 family peptidase n=1 Tax=Croceicoccus gelatinilyticus TaxID=2835536 RepID=UPI001BCCED77|nr:S41 family peptidase [Croceicoccus gelatinilyticus]MBS7670268.1 S41 family peptidase [Croceicoccus gelatinilyticus]